VTEQRERVTHPVWCDRDACTAPEFVPTSEEYRRGAMGAHYSSTMSFQSSDLQLFLANRVCPWETESYLVVRNGEDALGQIPISEAGGGFALYALLGQEVKEVVRKWPALYAERFPYVQRALDDESDEATAEAAAPRDPVELKEQMGGAYDQLREVVQTGLDEQRAALYGCTHPPDEPCFGKKRKATYPMSYRLTVNGKTGDPHGTFPEVRAAVADLVTRRLAVEPERVAAEAQTINAQFQTGGAAQQALDERAEWFTVFDAYGEEPLRIRITAERD
jgi:hypothetical protein